MRTVVKQKVGNNWMQTKRESENEEKRKKMKKNKRSDMERFLENNDGENEMWITNAKYESKEKQRETMKERKQECK